MANYQNNNNNEDKIVSTFLYSYVFFNNTDATKSKKFDISLLNRGINVSVFNKEGEVFSKKKSRGYFISQYQVMQFLSMLHMAKDEFIKGKEFELCMANSKSALGLFAMKKDDVLVGGFTIYDVADGLVLQAKRDLIPILPKNDVKSFDKQGTLLDVSPHRFVLEINQLISMLEAIVARTSNIYQLHMDKFYKENPRNNGGAVSGYAPTEAGTDSDSDEFPF